MSREKEDTHDASRPEPGRLLGARPRPAPGRPRDPGLRRRKTGLGRCRMDRPGLGAPSVADRVERLCRAAAWPDARGRLWLLGPADGLCGARPLANAALLSGLRRGRPRA